jgi:SAM-dependent methyltransferase
LNDETAEFWDAQARRASAGHAARAALYWFFYPRVREHVNVLMTGAPWGWPQLWLKSQFDLAYVPRRRGLSIGCGIGNLERSLRHLAVCDELLGVDISPESIRQARELAATENVSGLTYEVADSSALDFPERSFDAVFFNHSLHHIADPDSLLAGVNRWLKDDGFVYIDDYVGPSRDEWQVEAFSAAELAPAREALSMIPESLRLGPLYPPLDLSDPSEMIRSDRIAAAVDAALQTVLYRPYWGNVLFPLLNVVDGEAFARPEFAPLLDRLIAFEEQHVAAGAFSRPLFAFIIAKKRT